MATKNRVQSVVNGFPGWPAVGRIKWNVLSGLSFIIGWWAISLFYPPALLPGPVNTAQKIVQITLHERLLFHFKMTLFRVLAGFGVAMLISVTVGIMMGINEAAEEYFKIFILIGLSIPSLAIAMLTLMFFGIGNLAAISAITITIIPFITENMWEGTKNIDQDLIRMGNAFGANTMKMIREIVLPQLIPYIMSASRYGLSLAWKIAVIAEMLGLGTGVGYQINEAFMQFSMVGVLAWTLAFAMLMIFIEFGILTPIEYYLTSWQSDIEGGDVLKG
ncbi:MAG: ABC transporter permease [Halobacteriaceae archaeon]